MNFTRITFDPDQLDGAPCIRHLAVPVAMILGMIADGMTADTILLVCPELEREDIGQALHFAIHAVRDSGLSAKNRRILEAWSDGKLSAQQAIATALLDYAKMMRTRGEKFDPPDESA